jgi:hypothetical protein
MLAIEYAPVVQERTEPEVECILTDTVETEHSVILPDNNLVLYADPVDSIVICSDQTTETEMSLVTLLKDEPASQNYCDCCDGGIPPVLQNEKVRRRSSPDIVEQSGDCEDDFKKSLYFDQQSKRISSVRCNSNAHNRRYPSSK